MVTPRIERYVREHFGAEEAEWALYLLRDWRIPYREEPPTERMVAAVVLASDGNRLGLNGALRLADRDWRDLLVAGGLADAGWEARLDELTGPAADQRR